MEVLDKISSPAYIFDYGGTLDTGGQHWSKVLWHAWQQVGVPVDETRFRDAYVYAERVMGRTPLIGLDDSFRQTLDVKLRLEMEYAGCLSYKDKVLEVVYEQTHRHTAHSVEVLKQLATYSRLALVSNFYGNIHTVLREFGFNGLFQNVIESAVVGVRKPDPHIFLLGVEALGVQPGEVTVVGDSMEKDIIPACEAGCKTIWLRGEQWSDAPVDETLPDRIISDLNELL